MYESLRRVLDRVHEALYLGKYEKHDELTARLVLIVLEVLAGEADFSARREAKMVLSEFEELTDCIDVPEEL
jgi:hypothetical protein